MRRARFIGGAVALAHAAIAACADQPKGDDTVVLDQGARPPFDGFVGSAPDRGVNAYLARRCGSLDCHGQPGRGMVLYSDTGLRMPKDGGRALPGGEPLSALEIRANYISVVGLEPEVMGAVVHDRGDRPERLMLVRKPLGTERHKGGTIFTDATDPGYVCLTSWLRGKVDEGNCLDGAHLP